ncbi:MAG: hypothetical protein ACR2LF_11320 [Jatrophihabitantaceae bacterium]
MNTPSATLRRGGGGAARVLALIVVLLAGAGAVVFVVVAAVDGGGRTIRGAGHRPVALDFRPLLERSGAYALSDADGVGPAAAAGIRFTLTTFRGPHAPLTAALAAHGMSLLDSYPEHALYRSECPEGRGSCAPLSAAARGRLLGDISRHVQAARSDPTVSGYYLSDDYYADFRSELADVYRTIRQLDRTKPTVCGIELPLAYTPAHHSAPVIDRTVFAQASVNYSPRWCNAVLIYAYGPFTASLFGSTVEWDMSSTLPQALALLRAKGWDSATQPLIGTPQAFGYAPAVANGRRPQFVRAPTAAQLATQVAAFCRFGARSILAYAWRDGARGNVTELSSSPVLRSGLAAGVRVCRARFWTP